MLPSSITLFLVKPATNKVTIHLRELIEIELTVKAKNIGTCKVTINYDSDFLILTKGSQVANVTSGSFIRNFAWNLKALKISSDFLWIELIAETHKIYQVAGFNLKIIQGKEALRI